MSTDPFNTSKKNKLWKKFKEDNILTNFTVMLVPHKSCKQPIHLKMPVGMIIGCALLLIGLLCCTNYFAYSAYRLRQVAVENARLNKISVEQEEQLAVLEDMAGTIVRKLDMLTEEEQEIRGKIGVKEDADGMGGLAPTDSSISQQRAMLGDYVLSQRLNTLHNHLNDFSTMANWHEQKLDSLEKQVGKYNLVLEKQKEFMEDMPVSWPLYGGEKETSLFGYRVNPFNYYRTEFHTGYDLKCAYKAPIFAAGNGTVVTAGYLYGYGYTIEVDHGYGYKSMYAHCSALKAKVGDQVKTGDTIALAGSTGRSTGTHLHFGVSYKGEWINPKPLLYGDYSELVMPDFRAEVFSEEFAERIS